MREFGAFLDAVRFLTRIPVPSAALLEDDWLARATKYFPAVGALIGALSAVVLLVAGQLWSGFVPAVLAVAASVWFTGAFHEDGLADTTDGLGGGTSVEARLTIMKDSRIGTYGTLALVVGVLLRIGTLAMLPSALGAAALVAAHACGRGAGVFVMNTVPHAGNAAATKVMYAAGALTGAETMTATAFCALALLPVAAMAPAGTLVGLIAAGGLAAFVVRQARRLIGGATGDVLGAVEQVFEIGFLLGVAALRPGA